MSQTIDNWSMKVEFHLEAQASWEVNHKKDGRALMIILNLVPESFALQLVIKKTAKENWEILRVLNVGVDRVVLRRL